MAPECILDRISSPVLKTTRFAGLRVAFTTAAGIGNTAGGGT
jgi:hypothetical protein